MVCYQKHLCRIYINTPQTIKQSCPKYFTQAKVCGWKWAYLKWTDMGLWNSYVIWPISILHNCKHEFYVIQCLQILSCIKSYHVKLYMLKISYYTTHNGRAIYACEIFSLLFVNTMLHAIWCDPSPDGSEVRVEVYSVLQFLLSTILLILKNICQIRRTM